MNDTIKERMQRAYTKAYLGLASQNWERSMNENFMQCAYVGLGNLKCAIGHLADIPKEFSCAIDTYNADANIVRNILVKEGYLTAGEADIRSNEMMYFLTNLQRAHDGCRDPSAMKAAFDNLAVKYNLANPIDQAQECGPWQ